MLENFLNQLIGLLEYLFFSWEGWSFTLSLIYVVLSIHKKISAWGFAILASLSYGYVCLEQQLYATAALQAIFIVFAIYGFMQWKQQKKDLARYHKGYSLTWRGHIISLMALFILNDLIHYAMQIFGVKLSTYEVLAVAGSLVAQYLEAKLCKDSWYWWIWINSLYIYVNFEVDLYLMSLLYAILAVLSVQGLLTWHKQSKQSKPNLLNKASA